MRGMTFALCVTLSSLTLPQYSLAANPGEDVQALLNHCNAPDGSAEALYCVGYVGGAGDAMVVGGLGRLSKAQAASEGVTARRAGPVSICSDRIITHGAMIQAFKNWAMTHPENWSDDAVIGVISALSGTWPCQ